MSSDRPARTVLTLATLVVGSVVGGALAAVVAYEMARRAHLGCVGFHDEHVAAAGETVNEWLCGDGVGYAAGFVAVWLAASFALLVLGIGVRVWRNRARPA